MNLFNKNKNIEETTIKMLTDEANYFTNYQGHQYDSDIVRSCIRPFAKNLSKLQAEYIDPSKANNMYINLLLKEPNRIMSMGQLLEKVATQLELNNNAFILIKRDRNNLPIELYPISATQAEAVYLNQELDIRFLLNNSKTVQFNYNDIIHIKQDFYNDDIFGSSNSKALENLMEITESAKST